jgi:hypothetical protein
MILLMALTFTFRNTVIAFLLYKFSFLNYAHQLINPLDFKISINSFSYLSIPFHEFKKIQITHKTMQKLIHKD